MWQLFLASSISGSHTKWLFFCILTPVQDDSSESMYSQDSLNTIKHISPQSQTWQLHLVGPFHKYLTLSVCVCVCPSPFYCSRGNYHKKPGVLSERTSEPSKMRIMSAHAQKAVRLQVGLRSCGWMFAGNSAKLHPPAARRLQQQPSGRAEQSKHPCSNGSVDCQSFCIEHSFHVIMFPFSVVASDQWCV